MSLRTDWPGRANDLLPPGKYLLDLALEIGGLSQLAKRVKSHRYTLRLLMTRAGRVPYRTLLNGLSSVSGRSLDEVRQIFGSHVDRRTQTLLTHVRGEFSDDWLRMRIASRIGEQGSVSEYAARTSVDSESLRRWLWGQRKFLAEETLKKIARYEHLNRKEVGIPFNTAESNRPVPRSIPWPKGRKHSEHMRTALSQYRRKWWNSLSRRHQSRILGRLKTGHVNFFADEEHFLGLLIKQRSGHYRKFHRSESEGKLNWNSIAISVSCDIWQILKRKFPTTTLTIIQIFKRIWVYWKIPWRRPDIEVIMKFIKAYGRTTRPTKFKTELAKMVYSDSTGDKQVEKQWSRIRKSVNSRALTKLAEIVLGQDLSVTGFEALVTLRPGRPRKTMTTTP